MRIFSMISMGNSSSLRFITIKSCNEIKVDMFTKLVHECGSWDGFDGTRVGSGVNDECPCGVGVFIGVWFGIFEAS